MTAVRREGVAKTRTRPALWTILALGPRGIEIAGAGDRIARGGAPDIRVGGSERRWFSMYCRRTGVPPTEPTK
jgi:hypothetical protein